MSGSRYGRLADEMASTMLFRAVEGPIAAGATTKFGSKFVAAAGLQKHGCWKRVAPIAAAESFRISHVVGATGILMFVGPVASTAHRCKF